MGAVKRHISPASALVHFHICISSLEDSVWSKFWSLTKMPLPRNLCRSLPDGEPTPPQSRSSRGKSTLSMVKHRIMITQRILYPKKWEKQLQSHTRWKVSMLPFCGAYHNAYRRPWNKDHKANLGASSLALHCLTGGLWAGIRPWHFPLNILATEELGKGD